MVKLKFPTGSCTVFLASFDLVDLSNHTCPVLSCLNTFLKDSEVVLVIFVKLSILSLPLSCKQKLFCLVLSAEGVNLPTVFFISVLAPNSVWDSLDLTAFIFTCHAL